MNIWRNKNPEQGQSLVEFIIIVPLFFIVLSGVNLYLNQEIKSLTEDSAYDSLLISDSNFEYEERTIADWNGSHLTTSQYNYSILDNAINSSKYFNRSVNVTNGVFNDKKNVTESGQSDCTNNPIYKLNASQSGEFTFSDCADGGGFEKAKFSYGSIFENFKTTKKKQTGKSIYYPEDENFVWKNRHLMASNAIKYFMFTPEGDSFKSLYASLLIPKDKSRFNAECLMNPKTPNCSLPSLMDVWNEVALVSAIAQVGECDAEIILKCGPNPPCAALAAEQTAVALSGKQASLCPVTNNITKVTYEEVLATAEVYSLAIFASESAQRVSAPF